MGKTTNHAWQVVLAALKTPLQLAIRGKIRARGLRRSLVVAAGVASARERLATDDGKAVKDGNDNSLYCQRSVKVYHPWSIQSVPP